MANKVIEIKDIAKQINLLTPEQRNIIGIAVKAFTMENAIKKGA